MTTDLFGTPPATLDGITTPKHRGRRALTLGITAGAALALFLGGMAGTASAAPDISDSGSTTANVAAESFINLVVTTQSFTLTGVPGGTGGAAASNAAVVGTVSTNNLLGYNLTVQAETADMAGSIGNSDTIPVSAMSVVNSSLVPVPVSSTTAVNLATKGSRSGAVGGDPFSNLYSVVIPFVNEDTYTATLNYVATTI